MALRLSAVIYGEQQPPHYQASKTHCPQGHEYAGGNLVIGQKGDRICRQCGRERAKAWRESRKRIAKPG